MLPPALALTAVAAVVGLLLVVNGHQPGTAGRGTTADGALRTSGSHSPQARPVVSPAQASAAVPAASPAVSPLPAAAPKAPVLVLNNSRIYHLAHSVAGEISGAGWPVTGVGDYTGKLSQTTVYYSPGYEAAAKALTVRFHQVTRVLPRFPDLPGDAPLTLVVTRYWVAGG